MENRIEFTIEESKIFAIAQRFTGKDVTRFNLTGVLVRPDGMIVGSNGHVLFCGQSKIIDPPGTGALINFTDPLTLKLHGSLPISGRHLQIKLFNTDPEKPGLFEGFAIHYDRYLKIGKRYAVEVLEAKFPNWTSCIPKGKPGKVKQMNVNLKYMTLISKAFPEGSTIDFFGDSSPIVFRSIKPLEELSEFKKMAIVMPMRK